MSLELLLLAIFATILLSNLTILFAIDGLLMLRTRRR